MGPNKKPSKRQPALSVLCIVYVLRLTKLKHSTYSDAKDISSVVSIVLSNNLLSVSDKKRQHISQNKFENWSKVKCEWINQKKKDFKFKGSLEEDLSETDADSCEDY